MPDYTNRSLSVYTVKTNTPHEDRDTVTIETTESTVFGVTTAVGFQLPAGTAFALETTQGSLVTGILLGSEWLFRKSDEDLAVDRAKWRADMDAKNEKRLEENRLSYTLRETNLPHWLQERLQTFHEKGGTFFERDGWGYELAIAELAALMAGHTLEEIEEDKMVDVEEHSRNLGVSGNQYGFARGIARQYLTNPEISLAGTVSALSPLTGDAFYEGKESK